MSALYGSRLAISPPCFQSKISSLNQVKLTQLATYLTSYNAVGYYSFKPIVKNTNNRDYSNSSAPALLFPTSSRNRDIAMVTSVEKLAIADPM